MQGPLYAGGAFTMAGGGAANGLAQWDGSSWSALGSGMNGQVGALAERSARRSGPDVRSAVCERLPQGAKASAPPH